MKKKTVYEIVTERIIEKLKQGEIPWRRPWNA
jgi:antirestriction protein ArdC